MLAKPDPALDDNGSQLPEILDYLRSVANEGGLEVVAPAQLAFMAGEEEPHSGKTIPKVGRMFAVGCVGASVGLSQILDMLSEMFA